MGNIPWNLRQRPHHCRYRTQRHRKVLPLLHLVLGPVLAALLASTLDAVLDVVLRGGLSRLPVVDLAGVLVEDLAVVLVAALRHVELQHHDYSSD